MIQSSLLPRAHASRGRLPRLRAASVAAGVVLAACPAPLLLAAPASAAAAKHYDDFNGDGYRDLAVPYAYSGIDDGAVSFSGGAVLVTFGGPKGLTTKTQLVHQDSPGVPGAGEENDQFGGALASADLDRDGYADLAVGVPGETVGKKRASGAAYLFRGGSGGLKGARSAVLDKTLPGVAGGTVAQDYFGYDLRLRDLDRNGRADLAVSVPGENTVRILPGAKGGVTGAGSVVLRETGADLPE